MIQQSDFEVSDLSLDILRCRCVDLDTWWRYDNCATPFWRLYWNDQRGAWVVLNTKRHDLDPDFLTLIPPETPFSTRCEPKQKAIRHFYIEFELPTTRPRPIPCIHAFRLSPALKRAILEIVDGMAKPSIQTQALLRHLCYYALSSFPADGWEDRPISDRIRRVMKFAEDRGWSAIRNEELAAQVSMSPNAFIRRFREEVGEPPQSWLQSRRIRHCCIQLRRTSMSVDEIADAHGFYDRFHLSSVFKKYRGIAPAAFRKRL